eukprot:gene17789-biopygen29454
MSERIRARLASSKSSQAQNFPVDLVCAAEAPSLRDSVRFGCTVFRMKKHERHHVKFEAMGSMDPQGKHIEYREASRSWSLLEWAVRANQAVAVKVFGDHCILDTCSALHLAAERGNLDVVEILLQLHMSSVSTPDARGQTALMRAINARKEKVALVLMSKTQAKRLLKLTPEHRGGQSLLHMCAIAGLVDAVTHMLGCLLQLERRLRGDEENLSLHDFIHCSDKHPELCDYRPGEFTEAKEDQEGVEAGVDAEHREHWRDGRNADARHSERLKSATSWRVQSTLEARRMWTVPICVQGKGKQSRAMGGMGIARGTGSCRRKDNGLAEDEEYAGCAEGDEGQRRPRKAAQMQDTRKTQKLRKPRIAQESDGRPGEALAEPAEAVETAEDRGVPRGTAERRGGRGKCTIKSVQSVSCLKSASAAGHRGAPRSAAEDAESAQLSQSVSSVV